VHGQHLHSDLHSSRVYRGGAFEVIAGTGVVALIEKPVPRIVNSVKSRCRQLYLCISRRPQCGARPDRTGFPPVRLHCSGLWPCGLLEDSPFDPTGVVFSVQHIARELWSFLSAMELIVHVVEG
jgi:hypothetical protein